MDLGGAPGTPLGLVQFSLLLVLMRVDQEDPLEKEMATHSSVLAIFLGLRQGTLGSLELCR